MKKNYIYTFILISFIFILSQCGGNGNQQPRAGKEAFEQTCVACHGMDGNGQVAGAALLSKSKLSTDDIIKVITNGRNTMPAHLLSNEAEIKSVAEYIITLRN